MIPRTARDAQFDPQVDMVTPSFPYIGDVHIETRTLVPGGPRYAVAPSWALTAADRRRLRAAGWSYRASVRGWVRV